jgi:hypothetical protein
MLWNLLHIIEEIHHHDMQLLRFSAALPLPDAWHDNVNACSESKFITTMSSLLYAIAVILIIAWALGFFVYSAGSIIHILLVIAVVAILLRLIRGERV